MKILGLDIGTTTVSAAVVEDHRVLSHLTLNNDSFLPSSPWEKAQDPAYIRATAVQAVKRLLQEHPDIARIGITGQMHGILYLNNNGEPVSPLYTWQDGRGDLLYDEHDTYASYLSKCTGYPLATGYGIVTHFYNCKNSLVPENAVVFCAIHDYIAMALCGLSSPVTESSDAASFGCFDVELGRFDLEAMQKAGINCKMLPALSINNLAGYYMDAIPVYVAIGDNQASFLGATNGNLQSMLLNIGTGSQFSVYTPSYMRCPGLETRPFPGGGYLLVGAALCGGRAYALWEKFLRSAVHAMTGAEEDSCYEALNALLSETPKPKNLPIVTTLFQGTRQDPTLRGSITNLNTENFTPLHFTWALLEGIVAELHAMYEKYLQAGGTQVALIGSGNGLRKNRFLKQCFEKKFAQQVTMSSCTEEAATGAALFAAYQKPFLGEMI